MTVMARGRRLRCHCPTTGRLGNLKLPGLNCLFSISNSKGRKTHYTVEAISSSTSNESWIGINQTAANRYFEFFLRVGDLSRLAGGQVRREVRLGKSRIDFFVDNTYIEVKTPLIVLPADSGIPRVQRDRFDSDRLIRHMKELKRATTAGKKAKIVLCYLYDAPPFIPPPPDNSNAQILRAALEAERAGVERWQVNMRVSKSGVSLIKYFQSNRTQANGAIAARVIPVPA